MTAPCRRNDRLILADLAGTVLADHGALALRADGLRLPDDLPPCTGLRRTRAGWTAVHEADGLRIDSTIALCPRTSVLSRQDVLRNTGERTRTVSRCLARVALPSGHWQLFSQDSRWCRENQGGWQELRSAAVTLANIPGRATNGATPMAALRPRAGGAGLAVHVIPAGDWTIRVRRAGSWDAPSAVVIEAGLADEDLRLSLEPGESVTLPEVLLLALPDGDPVAAAPRLQTWWLERHPGRPAPVVCNTWFDAFDRLDPARLRRQLAAAKRAGCEVFTIDAGWFGPAGGDWSRQVGDWRERRDGAFHGRLHGFAAAVRRTGLGFGLWIEPERVGPDAPVVRKHPEWFLPAGAPTRIDLEQPAAAAWIAGEIDRLIRDYRLAWLKIDANQDFRPDPRGGAHFRYMECWHALLDGLRRRHPRTWIEGCASGGLRSDLATLAHVDSNFLSDTVQPQDVLRITQGALLRLPPGRLGRWAVLRAVGRHLPRYQKPPEEWPVTVVAAGGAGWEPSEPIDPDVAVLAAMPGAFGLSGDLAGLPPEVLDRLATWNAFIRRWRRRLADAVAHTLVPPEALESRHGWIAWQFHCPDGASLLTVFRLGDAGAMPAWRLRDLDPRRGYRVRRGLDGRAERRRGDELMNDGIAADGIGGHARSLAAAMWTLEPLRR